MAELADVPDLGSGAPGVQVRPLLAAPETPVIEHYRGFFFVVMKYMQKIHCCFLSEFFQKYLA